MCVCVCVCVCVCARVCVVVVVAVVVASFLPFLFGKGDVKVGGRQYDSDCQCRQWQAV